MIKNEDNYITEAIESGKHYKTGLEWFYKKYASIYNVRLNLFIIFLMLFVVIIFFLLLSVVSVSSVGVKNGVTSLESNFEDIFVIQKIPKYYSNNEKNILRFVIENYVMTFESYNVDKFSIYSLNKKIDTIKQYSNKVVGDKFEKIVRKNYTTEIFSGIVREAKIKSFTFINIDSSILDYLLPSKTPNRVVLEISSNLSREYDKLFLKEEERTVELTFNYNPIERDKDGNFSDLGFQVTSYNYLNL